jgi:hypothetical protein
VKLLATIIGFFVAAFGLVGVMDPAYILEVGRSLLTPTSLYGVAAFRIGVGVVLLLVAAHSRAPAAFRVFGSVIVLAGVLTLFLGVGRSGAILEWWSAQGPLFMRLCLALPLAMGLFIVYALTSSRRAAA